MNVPEPKRQTFNHKQLKQYIEDNEIKYMVDTLGFLWTVEPFIAGTSDIKDFKVTIYEGVMRIRKKVQCIFIHSGMRNRDFINNYFKGDSK